jgi:hypothetical protein
MPTMSTVDKTPIHEAALRGRFWDGSLIAPRIRSALGWPIDREPMFNLAYASDNFESTSRCKGASHIEATERMDSNAVPPPRGAQEELKWM